ncbi:MAG: hypothetical protein NW226_17145 [Microscillaceae bacterium]|nr:hypothetical protein [Microscillaceae bacterium]
MLVQHYYPQSLSPARLDKYLASGWFRSAPMLYRSQLICLEEEVFSTVNIRIKLENYEFRKSLRKIITRNDKLFRAEIKRFSLNQAKDRLYQQQKHRFKGFIFDTLQQFFYANLEDSVFDTYEVAVYDGDALVAVSFFDCGKNSLASILGLYDQNYEKYSLGTYTMLLEIDYGIRTGRKYYYPGYVLDKPSIFDYKLRLASEDMEYYNWKGRWKPMDKFSEERLLVHELREKIQEMENALIQYPIPYQRILYPLFSIGYLVFFGENFLRCTLFLNCFPEEHAQQHLIIEYLLEEGMYRLSRANKCPEYQEFINMRVSPDLSDPNLYCLELLRYERVIYEDNSIEKVIQKALENI